jgi:hypothetical protein
MLESMEEPNSVTYSCFAKYYLNKKDMAKSFEFVKKSINLDY